ncbi:uncharacterized protein C9orf152-like [Narcine bancroftii]|uniref:uncharacterized protein C9orf152-like n=1 Tax=Narcine bancroftii TaxID=1343680 RepID=UPI00383216FB
MQSHCCPNLKCVWEQMDRAGGSLPHGTDGRDHTGGQSWSCSSSVSMDINQLEVQYDSMRQKQREQTRVVFGPGENKQARGKFYNLPIKTVSVNYTVRESLSFEEDLPVNSVILDFPNKDYIQDGKTPWRTHLDFHRVGLARNLGQKSQVPEDKRSDDQNPQDSSKSRNIPSSKNATTHSHKKYNSEVTTPLACKANELEKTFYSFNNYNHCVPRINKSFSFSNERSSIWASKNRHVSRIAPITTKLDYYPFPHMKTPRKSATAKNLGLYNC